jgi:class 3 adenylate cyclase/tetratricopeptide (TPR) repeat protein
MFADLVGSTQLIDGLDPEVALERLWPSVEAMCETVTAFEGTVVRTLGDGLMALFGAPRAQEGHALLACQAALAILARFPAGKETPSVRIGLHSGGVVSGVIATDPTKERGAHGVAVHLASRLQTFADPGSICLTEDCHQLVHPHGEFRYLGRHAMKGFTDQVSIYQLLGLKPAVASQQFRGTNLSKLRGRSSELRILQSALSAGGRILGLSGGPGTGKSRLCFEFAESCRGRQIPVLEARAQIYGHATPLQLELDFLRLLFEISPTDDPGSAKERIRERAVALSPTFEADVPIICEFLAVPCDESIPPFHPKARQARLLDIVRHMVRQFGSQQAVIIVEDLHWLDEASADLILTLVDAIAGSHALLILNYRPTYALPWAASSFFQELPLAELNTSDTESLVEELIGEGPLFSDIRRRVAARSGGNPFFAEELVRSLAIERQDSGNQPFRRASDANYLPPTVEAVIAARIDRLGDREKATLQVAATIGEDVPVGVLTQVVDLSTRDLDNILRRLCEVEMLQKQSIGDSWQFTFRHPLIREVAYATQLRNRREALHAAVARAMTRYYDERLDELAGLISYHFEAANLLSDAAEFSCRAARWIGTTAPKEAIKHWERVRRLLQNQPRSKTSDATRIIANAQITWLGWREAMTADKTAPLIEEALAWARETDDTMVPMLLFVEGRIALASGGSADHYVEQVREGLSLLAKDGSQLGRAATLYCALSQAYGWAGLLREALSANDLALAGARHVDKFDRQFLGLNVEHWAVSLRGRLLVRLGRFSEGEACLKEMIEIQDQLLDPTLRFVPHLGYVDLAWCRGDIDLAKYHARRVKEIADLSGSAYLRVYTFACSGTAKSMAGDFRGAINDFGEGHKFLATAKASLGYEAEILSSLAECYCQLGEVNNAIQTARSAIEVSSSRKTRLGECRGCIALAMALNQHPKTDVSQVAELLAHASSLIEITGARIYARSLAREEARLHVAKSVNSSRP